jgi:hypothetical protein
VETAGTHGERRLPMMTTDNAREARIRAAAKNQLYSAISELGEHIFDDALVIAETDQEAAFLASAYLVASLERERLIRPILRAA